MEVQDGERFRIVQKLTDDIWEFRTLFHGKQIRLLSFWDKNSAKPKIVVCTHGFVKKDWKVPQQEIDKAVMLMKKYYKAGK